MRIGFAVKVLGRPQLKSHDSRRWQNHPHLSVSLAYLRDILLYLDSVDIRMYRMQSDLAPYATHPDLPEFHNQIAECQTELDYAGQLAQDLDIRLSFHTHPYTVLNSPNGDIAQRSIRALEVLTGILDSMHLGGTAVIVTHVGGIYGDRQRSLERFVERYQALPATVQARLVLENDEERYGVGDTHWVHRQTGIPLVWDRLHFLLNNPERMSVPEALGLCLGTWPDGLIPKAHYSSPRTEMKALPAAGAADASEVERVRVAPWRNHSDYVNPFEFAAFLRQSEGLPPFDVMLEAKAKDLAVIRLRQDLADFEPRLTDRWAIH